MRFKQPMDVSPEQFDNTSVINYRGSREEMKRTRATKSFDALLAKEQLADPEFRAEWQRLAPARAFSTALLRYRADNDLNQRQLAHRLGVSQPRIAKLESGEHNPGVDTIINAVRRLGIEFCLDVSPVGSKPALLSARALRSEAIHHDAVSVVASSSA